MTFNEKITELHAKYARQPETAACFNDMLNLLNKALKGNKMRESHWRLAEMDTYK
jgi:hypothetical protein